MSEQEKVNGTGLARIVRAMRCTGVGLAAAYRNEEAFRQELLACLALLPVACWLGHSNVERALLAGSLVLLLIVELLNTAVEVVVNRIGPERHELSGLAKDLGSAAVFMAIVHVVVVWSLVLFF
ncbi:MAG: diacylglycerol kinase [Desulfobulbus sp.]|jgi:diacylglycerol kinase (ATP)|uniref:diacylglycerol kinase n=1 Tax=Desulfobulbus sp. TaxID=895 RepID=UPI0028432A01|nr:diacylglycerol kinase [Desulfobulbus sp.]MDR2551246.1 diacylglycerol kinase [Desulfobulbus sp.]